MPRLEFLSEVGPVSVRITPTTPDGALLVHAPGFAVDAVYPDSFGGFQPYSRGNPLFPGRPACRSVDRAIQSALAD